jgi:hypothetical protein
MYKNLGGISEGNFEDLGVHRRIILKWILQN